MSTDPHAAPRSLPDRPNLRHLKNQAKDLVKAGTAKSITDAQFTIARLYGFPSWPKLKAYVDSFEQIGQLKQAIDTNDLARVKAELLVEHGADLSVRVTLPGHYDRPDEFVECTPLGYALRFVNEPPRAQGSTMAFLRERGAIE